MARLILKSPYIKSTGGASGYLRYIATRERVELIPDDRPPTRKQEQLIVKLVKDFPDSKTLYEYEDYLTKPTKVNASAFITLALESNWDAIHESDQYMKYIATRPRAERIGTHGLFGDDDAVSLEKAMAEVERYTGNVWTHIISLKREDAARLGFDNAAAWRNLIRAHRNDIAAAMKIPPGDFRWYAAFHDEGEHPHIHMMAWSAKPGQAYLSKEGIRQIKSKLTNDIFRNEMLHLYEQKSESRDELVREARRALLELVQTMRDSMCDHPDAERLVLELAAQLETVKGKKSYGYLPKRLKKLVDEIVDEMERLPGVSKCYDQWLMLQGKVDSYYHDKPQERIPLSQQKEFRQIKNAVIQEAERLRLGEITFEEKGLNQQDEPEECCRTPARYWTMPRNTRGQSLLSGNVFCGHCGGRLTLTTNGTTRINAAGEKVGRKRIRYVCYNKTRKRSNCDGQTGYTMHILDKMVTDILHQVFDRMRSVEENEIISRTHRSAMVSLKKRLADAKAESAKAAKEYESLKLEIIKAVQGESAFPMEVLSELVNNARTRMLDANAQLTELNEEVEKSNQRIEAIKADYRRIMEWSEMFDGSDMDVKKMIAGYIIKRVDVYSDYRLHIEFNMSFAQFELGLETEVEYAAQDIVS